MQDFPDIPDSSRKLSQLLLRGRSLYDYACSMVIVFHNKIESTRAYELFMEHKNRIVFVIYLLCFAGSGYWLYHLTMLDVQPLPDFRFVLKDSREALVILFFGVLGLVFLIFFVLFLLKFLCNLFEGGIETLFASQWHSIVRPLGYLIILYFVFSFTGTIKVAGLTAYCQVADLVRVSNQHDFILKNDISLDAEEKMSMLLKLMDREEQD
jgi:hypothetical protein